MPRRARRTGNVFWGCSKYPKCDYTTNDEPLGGLHDADDGPIGAQGRGGDLPGLRLDDRDGAGRHRPGERYAGGPANPAALARPARARGGGGGSGRSGGARPWTGPLGRPRDDPTDATRRTGRRRVSGVALDPATPPALARFLRTLAARDASPHTRRSYATAIGAYLAWLAARGVDWRTPGRADLRAYLAELTTGHARSSVAQRLAAIRSFHRWAARDGLAPGDPWGAIATPRQPGRLPRVLEVDDVGALLDVVTADLADAAQAGSPERVALATALALRDRALVETAYAAGLRISELADAELGELDLRRGELRVIGKGRKERIGLLGRPARAAIAAYLEDGRPDAPRTAGPATTRRRPRSS